MNNWYLIIECDNTVADPFVANKYDPLDFDDWSLASGKYISDWNNSLTLRADSENWDGEPDDVLQNALGLPVYSERLQTALKIAGFSDIQYLPLRVEHSDGSEIPGFAIANILKKIPCLDLDKAKYRLHTRQDRLGECRSIEKIVLVRSAIERLDLFRMQEFRLNLIVSDRFKETFEQGSFTGYSFSQVQVSEH